MKLLKLFLFISFYISFAFSAVHENAEDKSVARWTILSPSDKTRISNYYDRKKGSHVIRLVGEGTQSAFKLDAQVKYNLSSKSDYWLMWDMKYDEDFIIMVIVKTNMGKDYLLYTSGESNSHKQYGLGDKLKDGKWHTIRRNIQKDLSYYDNRKVIVSFCSFVIRGSGSVDNIITKIHLHKKSEDTTMPTKELKIDKKVINSKNKKLIKKRKVVKRSKMKSIYKHGNTLPKIHILGDNPLYLNIGERYVEQGVTATDKEDGKINVVSIEDIDIRQSGDYSVMYMATDSDGNSAVDIRYVVVGDGKHDREAKSQEKYKAQKLSKSRGERQKVQSEPNETKESVDEEILEQREEEISEWERELEERENEISKKEREMSIAQ